MAVPAKISLLSREIAREIILETGKTQIDVIEHAMVIYRREWRMQKLNEAYDKLQKNKKKWEEELKERSEWEKTLIKESCKK